MKEVQIFDKRLRKHMKFLWDDINKFEISIKALRKAQREGKIDILWEEGGF